MKISNTLTRIWLFVSILTLFGCQTVEVVFYEHGPSERFYKSLDISDPSLAPYYRDDTVFVVRATAGISEYYIWLGAFSERENKQVKVTNASISANGLLRESTFSTLVEIDTPTKNSGLLHNPVGTLNLFVIDEDLLYEVTQGDSPIEVKVNYEIDGSRGMLEYELWRRVQVYPDFPT